MPTPVSLVDTRAYVQGTPAIKHRLATVVGINLTSTGATVLYTTPTGFTAIVTDVLLEATAADTVTVAPTVGAGVAAGEDDVFAPVALTGLDTVGKVWPFVGIGLMRTVPAASVLSLGVDVGATAVSLVVTAHVFGFFF